jgi:hypothetical protein
LSLADRLYRLACRIGVLDGPEAAYYRDMRWRWDFWNGSHSWLAYRYARRHGYRAYAARYSR